MFAPEGRGGGGVRVTHLISKGTLIIRQQVPGQRVSGRPLHLSSDPAELLLHIQQRQSLLQGHTETAADASQPRPPHGTSQVDAHPPKELCTALFTTLISSIRPAETEAVRHWGPQQSCRCGRQSPSPSPSRCWMLDRYCCWTSGGARGVWGNR